MRRRDLVVLLGGCVFWPLAADSGRTEGLPRLAVVNVAYPVSQLSEEGAPQYRAFFEELRRLGHIEGNTIIVERWSADGRESSSGSSPATWCSRSRISSSLPLRGS